MKFKMNVLNRQVEIQMNQISEEEYLLVADGKETVVPIFYSTEQVAMTVMLLLIDKKEMAQS